jgi:alginate O-acetyltransferase complex protein AlgJ
MPRRPVAHLRKPGRKRQPTRISSISTVNSTAQPACLVADPRELSATSRLQGLSPPTRPAWTAPFYDMLLSLLFVIFLISPLIGWWVGGRGQTALRENRNLAPAPALGVDPIASLPAEVEAYYTDRFGFREPLIRFYNTVLHKYLKASNDDVVIGKNGWIFYARENIFQDYFGLSPFSEAELSRWKNYLENRRSILAGSGFRYLFVIAPDKNTIYPEMLPDFVRDHHGRSRVDQLREYLRAKNSPVDVLDLHAALLAAKPQGTLYYPQDTHWNGRGFFVAYQAICGALRGWFPEIVPQILGHDYTIREEPWDGGEWGLFGLPEENLKYHSEFLIPLGTQKAHQVQAPRVAGVQFSPEPWNAPLYWEGNGRESLLVLHDSYMRTGALDRNQVPLAEHFARTLLVGGIRTDQEFKTIVDTFHPDVVIEERAERILRAVPPRAKSQTVPEVISFSPPMGTGPSAIFAAVYASAAGGEDVMSTQVVIADSLASRAACYFGYDRRRNQFLLLNDEGKAWLPNGVPPGSGTLSNGQCTISGLGSSAGVSGNQLIVTYHVEFKKGFAGPKRIWTNAYSDESGLGSPWQSNVGGAALQWNITPTR